MIENTWIKPCFPDYWYATWNTSLTKLFWGTVWFGKPPMRQYYIFRDHLCYIHFQKWFYCGRIKKKISVSDLTLTVDVFKCSQLNGHLSLSNLHLMTTKQGNTNSVVSRYSGYSEIHVVIRLKNFSTLQNGDIKDQISK